MSQVTTAGPGAGPSATPAAQRQLSATQAVGLIAKREIVTKLRDRAFLISTLVFIIIIAGVVMFNVIMSQNSNTYAVGVVKGADQQLVTTIGAVSKEADADVVVTEYPDLAAVQKAVQDGDVDVAVNADSIYSKSAPSQTLQLILQQAHQIVQAPIAQQAAGVTPDQVAKLQVQPLKTQLLDSDDQSLQRGIIAIIAVGIAYFMLMMSGQFVAQGVVEEKSSRVVELLMATVRPWQLLAGKVLGLGVLGLLQMVLITGVGLGIGLGTGLLDVPAAAIGTILQVLGWFVLGYTFFACLFAAAASLVSRQEDLGSAVGPLSFIPVVAFFMAFAVLNNPEGTLSRIVSLVPGLSPITMPVRSAMTSVPIWEYLLAIVLQILAIVALIRLAGRIYAGSMLRTGGKVKIREALANAE